MWRTQTSSAFKVDEQLTQVIVLAVFFGGQTICGKLRAASLMSPLPPDCKQVTGLTADRLRYRVAALINGQTPTSARLPGPQIRRRANGGGTETNGVAAGERRSVMAG